ncbi:MAG: hypothetical protein Q8L89_08745 [Gammaproteobacteria bacterium]|nr:hypothetical protein [Gammaproteobacteria bacterium]
MKFSTRYTASKEKQEQIIEDAPRSMRIGYIKGILGKFVSESSRYSSASTPLDAYDVHLAFTALIRDEADPWDYSHESAWEGLTTHLKDCKWYEFYDFVEMLGKQLLEKDDLTPFSESDYFKQHQHALNALFQEDSIGWSLNENSELYRSTPKALADRSKRAEELLTDRFATARIHFQKATSYLYRHPVDEANSIKEIVSAIESVARVLHPNCSTLGDAIKVMRNDQRYSRHLIEAIEKLYVFSNATPLVRHGHSEGERPKLSEAELSLHVGIAFIRYLIEAGGKSA